MIALLRIIINNLSQRGLKHFIFHPSQWIPLFFPFLYKVSTDHPKYVQWCRSLSTSLFIYLFVIFQYFIIPFRKLFVIHTDIVFFPKMKVLVVVLSVLALSQAQVQVRLPFINPAGVRYTGAGFGNIYSVSLHRLFLNFTKLRS